MSEYLPFLDAIASPGLAQSPENDKFFLGTTRTFQKLPTFLSIFFTFVGLLWAEWMYILFHNYLFLTFLHQIIGKFIQKATFYKRNIKSSYFS